MRELPEALRLRRRRPALLLYVAHRRLHDVVCGRAGRDERRCLLDYPWWKQGAARVWVEDIEHSDYFGRCCSSGQYVSCGRL